MKKGKTNIHRTKIVDHILKNRYAHLRSIFFFWQTKKMSFLLIFVTHMGFLNKLKLEWIEIAPFINETKYI
jgi:hypothetical protein